MLFKLAAHDRFHHWSKHFAGDDFKNLRLHTFNDARNVTLWAGVSPVDYPSLTVTIEAADGNQASSGRRVLVGNISR